MHNFGTEKSGRLVQYSGTLLSLLVVAFVAVFVVASFNPGCLNADTLDQWGQSGLKIYHDWHPAVLAILMTYVRRVYDGLQAVVILQVLLFTTGVVLVVRRHAGPLFRSILLLGLTFVPPLLSSLGFVGKDSFMAVLLVFAIGAIYEYHETRHPALLLVSLVALYLAFAVRHNAVFAVLPLLVWLLYPRGWMATGLWVGIVFLCFLGLGKVTSLAFHVRHEYPEQGLFLYDLAALSVKNGTILVPPKFEQPGTSLASIQRDLDPFEGDRLFWGPSSVFYFSEDPDVIHHLMQTWVRSALRYPGAYLQWRWDVFAAFIGLRSFELQPYIDSCVPPNTQGFVTVDSRLHWRVMNRLQATGQSILFRPYFYLCILVFAVGFGILKRRWDIAMIAASGGLYCITYAGIIYQSTFRFACFTVFAALIIVARLVAEWAAKVKTKLLISNQLLAFLYILGSVALGICLALTIHRAWPRDAALAGTAKLFNGDFETGGLSPWLPFQETHAKVTSDQVLEGKYSLAEADGSGGIYQDVAGLKAGRTYRISAVVSASPGTTASARLTAGDPSTKIVVSSEEIIPQGGWILLPLRIVADSSGSLRVQLVRGPGIGTIYWDNIRIYDR